MATDTSLRGRVASLIQESRASGIEPTRLYLGSYEYSIFKGLELFNHVPPLGGAWPEQFIGLTVVRIEAASHMRIE